MENLKLSVAGEAIEVVEKNQKAYGKPTKTHQRTADLFNAFIKGKYSFGFTIDAKDVCMFNLLQKVSREANSEKRDNMVDIIGYAINYDIVQQGESEPWQ